MAERAKKIMLQEYLCPTGGVPEIEGVLYMKDGYKKPWKKYFFILRSSGLYFSTKGKSKVRESFNFIVQVYIRTYVTVYFVSLIFPGN